MVNEGAARKLTTILAADVVGYSRLVAADEEGTVAALKNLRSKILNPLVAHYHGQVVKLIGDGILMQFGSVVDGVRFAIEFQKRVKLHNADIPADRCLEYRIGVNIGDVMIEGNDIYGDGVNIAARLEALAETGGICVSSTVIDHIGGKVDISSTDLGEQQLKNIPGTFRVYAINPGGETHTSAIADKSPAPKDSARKGDFFDEVTGIDLTVPDTPSIAVLPFANMSADPEQEFFSDGITEDIITTLSKTNDLLVVARNSTFIYKGQAVDIKQVSRDQGVRYVLEGSVRKAANRVRVTAQLIDATTGHHRWAERYDRNLEDIFAVQDEITREVVVALDVNLLGGTQAITWSSGTQNIDAWEYARRGMEVLNSLTTESPGEAEQLFLKALELDPGYPMALVGLGWSHHHGAELRTGKFSEESWNEAHDKARDCGKTALDMDPYCADAYSLLSLCHLSSNEYDQAIEMSEKAIALAPSHAEILGVTAIVMNKSGQPQRALELIKKAMRCCPIYPSWYLQALGIAYRLTGQIDAAITTFGVAQKRSPDYLATHVNLASTLGEADRQNETRKPVSEILRIQPNFSIRQYMNKMSYRHPEELERFAAGLHKAGLPE
jgi:adenylate cyclase